MISYAWPTRPENEEDMDAAFYTEFHQLESRVEQLERENEQMRQVLRDYSGPDWAALVLDNPVLIADATAREEAIADLAFQQHLAEREAKRQLALF